jgi:hypothetical protein
VIGETEKAWLRDQLRSIIEIAEDSLGQRDDQTPVADLSRDLVIAQIWLDWIEASTLDQEDPKPGTLEFDIKYP